jgi:hypothetical protein
MTESIQRPPQGREYPRRNYGRPPRERRRKPSAVPIAAFSVAMFMALFGFMSYELATGHDPALGKKTAVVAQAPRRVVLKRIEHRIVITRIVPPPAQTDAGSAAATSVPSSAAPTATAPVAPVTTSAPVVVQSAPAPAPAPAPVQTRTS